MILLIDNYDSFTFILYQYLKEWDEVIVIKNDEPLPDLKLIKSVVISPGPGKPKSSGNLMMSIDTLIGQFPMLGVCLGHQALAEYYGAKLMKAPEIFHGRASEIVHDSRALYKDVPNHFKANRYHSWVVSIENLPEELEVTAKTKDGVVMGIMSKIHHNTFGVQFHPESILTEFGHDIIRNFCEISR